MTLCTSKSIVNLTDGVVHAASLRCRSWGCETCGPNRKKQLIAQASSGNPSTIITLTLRADPSADRGQEALKLSRAWRIIRLRLMRLRRIKKLPYIAVVEQTKNGTPHLHILCRAPWIDQRWLSAQAAEILNAPIVDIRKIDNPGRAGGYVAKYVAKDSARLAPAKRYWATRDYEIPRERKAKRQLPVRGGWSVWDETVSSIAYSYACAGRKVSWIADGLCRVERATGPPRFIDGPL